MTIGSFTGAHINGFAEAIVPLPAFEMYSVFVKAAGGRVVPISPKDGFTFPLNDVCDAITAPFKSNRS